MARQLLVDTLNIRLRVEEGENGGKLVARGQYAVADKATANNRVYRRGLWEREIRRLAKAMQERRVFGELDHPADGRTKLQRVSHLLTNLVVQSDGQVVGESEILNTAMGKELKAILDGGGAVGVSSRGYGSVKSNELGEDVVQEDFQLDTFDFVVDPAQGTAYPDFTVESEDKPASAPLDGAKPDTEKDAGSDSEVKEEDDDDKEAGKDAAPAPEAPAAPAPEVKKDDEPKSESLNWANLPADLKKEFAARVAVAVSEAKATLRTEVKVELLADPAVAGARAALDEVKALLRPYVLEGDANQALEAKDREIAQLRERLATQESLTKKVSEENVQLTRAVKDLGFNLYLQKSFGDHPKFTEVVESLGDLSKIESLDDLKKRVKLFESEIAKIREGNRDSTKKLLRQKEDQIKSLGEQVTRLTANNKKMASERDQAMTRANDAMTMAYLERKIVGNPFASKIRVQYEHLGLKTKASVDQLVESFRTAPRQTGERDFERIRARLGGRVTGNLVENALKGTLPTQQDKVIEISENLSIPLQDFESLSGIKHR